MAASRCAASSSVGAHEARLVLVLRPTGHAGVPVAEELDAVRADDRVGRCGLGPAPVDDRLALCEVVGRVAVVTVGRHDEHDAMTLLGRAGHRPRRLGRLVVGMGVHEHHSCHGVHPLIRVPTGSV